MVKGRCLLKAPDDPYADSEGYVPFGELVDYSAGRSNGCTSWSPSGRRADVGLGEGPTDDALRLSGIDDIVAVTRAVKAGRSPSRAGLYWNASWLREIGSPNFWPRETLEPALVQYKEDHPPPRPQAPPICTESADSSGWVGAITQWFTRDD